MKRYRSGFLSLLAAFPTFLVLSSPVRADEGGVISLVVELKNNSSRKLLVEEQKGFRSDNPAVRPVLRQQQIPSRSTGIVAIITWPEEGESAFRYKLDIKSDNGRYDCSFVMKSLYYDSEVDGTLVVRPKIETPHPVDDLHPACAAYKFSTSFEQKDNNNGIVHIVADNF